MLAVVLLEMEQTEVVFSVSYGPSWKGLGQKEKLPSRRQSDR